MADSDVKVDELPLLLTPVEVGKVLRSSRSVVYPLLSSGQLPSVKLGRKRFVRRDDLIQFIEQLESDPTPSKSYRPPRTKAAKVA